MLRRLLGLFRRKPKASIATVPAPQSARARPGVQAAAFAPGGDVASPGIPPPVAPPPPPPPPAGGPLQAAAPAAAPAVPAAAPLAAPSPSSSNEPSRAPAPSAQEEASLPESTRPAATRVRVVLDDGTVAPAPEDPEIRERLAYLADNILKGDKTRGRGA